MLSVAVTPSSHFRCSTTFGPTQRPKPRAVALVRPSEHCSRARNASSTTGRTLTASPQTPVMQTTAGMPTSTAQTRAQPAPQPCGCGTPSPAASAMGVPVDSLGRSSSLMLRGMSGPSLS